MMATTCPTCRQIVAKGFAGIRPHQRHGQPCPGGLPALTLRADAEPSPASDAVRANVLVGQAKRNAGMAARRSRRDDAVRALLPAASIDIARALGISTDSARTSCLRLGAVLDGGSSTDRTRLWRLSSLAEEAAK